MHRIQTASANFIPKDYTLSTREKVTYKTEIWEMAQPPRDDFPENRYQ